MGLGIAPREITMTWERRLRELLLAGGTLATLGCTSSAGGGSGGPNIPCGNANADPCICGRPEASAEQADLCDKKTSCEAAGGVFDPSTCLNCASDGGVLAPHCTFDGGAPDASKDAAGHD
jgi:hypothetical protein